MKPDRNNRAGTLGSYDPHDWHQHGSALRRKGPGQFLDFASDPAVMALRPLIFAFALMTGAIIYFLLPFEPASTIFILLGFGAFICAVFARISTGPAIALSALMLSGLLFGLSVAKAQSARVDSRMIKTSYGPVMTEGWVTAIEPSKRGVRVRLRVHAVAGVAQPDLPKTIRLTHTARLAIAPGRFVRCWAVLRPPPGPALPGDYDFQRQAWFEGLDAVGYVQGRCRGGVLGRPAPLELRFKLRLASLQRNLAIHVRAACGERAGGFAAALITGDRSFMPQADQEALRGSGLAHLLAISGLHLGIVGGLVFLIVRRGLALIEWLALRVPVQKPAALAALVSCLIYLVLSGASVSTQRAFIMAAVVFGAILFDRPGISLRSFAIAMIIIVVLHPNSVLSPGFQMSFAATGALIAVYEAWAKRRQGAPRGWFSKPAFALKSLVVTSIVAALATGPYAMYHFGRLAGMGLWANLLAMPIITFLTAPAAALALLLAPFGLSDIGLRLFGMTLEAVLVVAHYFDGTENAIQTDATPMPGASLVFFSIAIGAAIIGFGRARLLGIALPTLAASLIWVSAPRADAYWVPSGDVIIRTQAGGLQKIEFAEADGLGSLRFTNIEPARNCTDGLCVLETASGKILLLHGQADETICAAAIEASISLILAIEVQTPVICEIETLPLTAIEMNGGASITLGETGVRMQHVPPCGYRPWYVCPISYDSNQAALSHNGE